MTNLQSHRRPKSPHPRWSAHQVPVHLMPAHQVSAIQQPANQQPAHQVSAPPAPAPLELANQVPANLHHLTRKMRTDQVQLTVAAPTLAPSTLVGPKKSSRCQATAAAKVVYPRVSNHLPLQPGPPPSPKSHPLSNPLLTLLSRVK